MTTQTREVPRTALCFALGEVSTEAAQEGDTRRSFSGVANSGGIIPNHWFWGNFAIDLAGMRINRQDLPVLRDHDTSQIVGFTDSVGLSGHRLTVAGRLIASTDAGREAIALLDDGVPLQMSVYAPPGQVLEVPAGESREVNGQTLHGPGHVFLTSTLREVTLTALGADDATGAELLSDSGAKVTITTLREEQGAEPMSDELTAAALEERHPSVFAEVTKMAEARGEKRERERIAFVHERAERLAAPRELIGKAITDGWSRDVVNEQFANSLADAKSARLQQLVKESPQPRGQDEAPADPIAKMAEGEEKWRAEFAANTNGVRDEFTSEGSYLAFRKRGEV